MNTVLILYPAFVMFALTLGCVFYLGFSRFRAIQLREVRISYFRSYNEGAQPERLHLLGRHIQNHFEVPPLFHIGVVLAFATQSVNTVSLTLAWLFVGLRVLHTAIHLGGNNVNYRFLAFGSSLMALGGLWATVLLSVVGKGG